MIFLMLYALAIWIAVFLIRRKWLRILVLTGAASIVPLAAHTLIHLLETNLARPDQAPLAWLSVVGDTYAALVFAVGLFIALTAKRKEPHDCRACGYDLAGNTSGACPECGHTIPSAQRRILPPAAAPVA